MSPMVQARVLCLASAAIEMPHGALPWLRRATHQDCITIRPSWPTDVDKPLARQQPVPHTFYLAAATLPERSTFGWERATVRTLSLRRTGVLKGTCAAPLLARMF